MRRRCTAPLVLLVLILLCRLSSSAYAAPAAWKQSAALSAPEAVQAAAADDKYVYAIANTLVAKYDRQSGERVATSTGKAMHLNSGFFHSGKLYCAHSNYPRKPEKSEIMVLDPATMQLATFKDFGNFGGSLTWCVRHDGHWWCNFARYGADNAATFLVKFDDNWREASRWTYPTEVTSRLKAYSLSGGIWRDGLLLTTDHDHGRLYCLRLPKQGNVLKFVETQSVPFTGQGIAADPKTGGLVGINRAKKQIVFAKQENAKAAAKATATTDRPNIVFILADDAGLGDFGCYGGKQIPAPNIDSLAKEGMRSTNAYSGSALCAPTRCVLMTGQHTGLLTSHIDFLATAAELATAEAPAETDGISIAPTFLGREQKQRPHLYWEIYEPVFQQAVRLGDWKGYRTGTPEPLQLYNLKTDPTEATDVAQAHPIVVKQIEAIMTCEHVPSPHFDAPDLAKQGKKARKTKN